MVSQILSARLSTRNLPPRNASISGMKGSASSAPVSSSVARISAAPRISTRSPDFKPRWSTSFHSAKGTGPSCHRTQYQWYITRKLHPRGNRQGRGGRGTGSPGLANETEVGAGNTLNSLEIPRVSIGLPVYNGETYLRQSIDSILSQTFRDFELIIC